MDTRFINSGRIIDNMGIRRDAIKDLVRIKNEFDSVIESLELMSDEEFMKSFKKAKDQVNNRDFDDWNDL